MNKIIWFGNTKQIIVTIPRLRLAKKLVFDNQRVARTALLTLLNDMSTRSKGKPAVGQTIKVLEDQRGIG